MLAMDRSKDKTIEEVSMTETTSREKTNKCNQCGYASSYAGNLRTHLKTHTGEKPNKCNQCDYASSYASALRTHLKTHSGENPTHAANAAMLPFRQSI